MNKHTRTFLLLITVGLLIRILIVWYAFQWRDNTDILRWHDWGRISFLWGLADTYKPDHLSFGTFPNNCPPLSLYIIAFFYQVNLYISKIVLAITHVPPGSIQFLNGQLFTLLLRIPSIFADIGIAVCIYTFVKKFQSHTKAVIASMMYYLNPVVLYNSAFWGQMESVVTFFGILTCLLLYRKRYFWSAICYGLSLSVKFTLLYFLPWLLLFVYLREKKFKPVFMYTFIIIIFSVVMSLPVSSQPWLWYPAFVVKNVTGEMYNVTAFALNFWFMIFHPVIKIFEPTDLFSFSEIRLIGSPFVAQKFFGIPLSILTWGTYLLTLLPVVHLVSRKRKPLTANVVFSTLTLVALLSYMLLPTMHERYLYPFFPLIAIAYGLGAPYVFELAGLTIMNLWNLLVVWHPMPALIPLYAWMNNSAVQWLVSAATVAFTIRLYMRFYRTFRNT